MSEGKERLIVALDVSTLNEAMDLVDTLSPVVDIFKVGSQLFTACGPAAVRFVIARQKKVFLDLKYHDIPNTVANAVKEAVGLSVLIHGPKGADNTGDKEGVFMLTMHTLGGDQMLERAVEAARTRAQELKIKKPLAVGITVLTSEKKEDSIQSLVLDRAILAKKAGLDGVVASVEEAPLIRKELGKDFLIVTPGIRPEGSGNDDQKRVATPKKAIESGSDFLVVGRPIIKSDNPLESAKNILEEIKKG